MSELLRMCWEFFKTGLFSVGGGLATLPFLYKMADRFGWFTRSMLSDMIAVSESTPGPVGVNMSTYAGYVTGGILGAVLATFSLVLPSVIVILIVARFLSRFQSSPLVRRAMNGLRPASVGLIAAAGLGILQLALHFDFSKTIAQWMDYRALGLGAAIAVLYRFKMKWHPIVFVGIGAAAGLIFSM